MKACLMKVNYDPKYMTPHIPTSSSSSVHRGPSTSNNHLQSRVTATRQIYNSNGASGNSFEKKTQDQVHHRAKERLKQVSDDLKAANSNSSSNNASATSSLSALKLPPAAISNNRITSKTNNNQSDAKEHGTGKSTNYTSDSADVKGNSQVRLMKLVGPDDSTILKPSHTKYQATLSCNLPSSSTSSQRMHSSDALSKSVSFPKPINVLYPRQLNQTSSFIKSHDHSNVQGSSLPGSMLISCQRSKTTLPSDYFNFKSSFQLDLERRARMEAEQAMKNGKVFTVMGPYPSLRAALRKRGWVEKFQNSASGDGTVSIPKSVLAEINDNVPNESSLPNVQRKGESNALAMMSHYVRNCTPTLLFSVKAVDVVSRPTKSNQLVNHFGRASTLTTKAGLCQCLRSVPWFESVDPNTFYPRCFNLGEADEKEAFIEDYRLTASMGFIKHFVAKYRESSNKEKTSGLAAPCSSISEKSIEDATTATPQSSVQVTPTENPTSSSMFTLPEIPGSESSDVTPGSPKVVGRQAKTGTKQISIKALKFAIKRCEKFLAENDHDDIDILDNKEAISETEWNSFLDVYHQFINDESEVNGNTSGLLKVCEDLLECLQLNWSQFQLDGIRDIWILKPGAKSRGRGIQCANQLTEIMDAIAASDCALVAQKYIEKPFLIYNTKFDIRQWFLVTDWNPLTMWFYNDCYLRFCSKEFSLNSFHVSIHLSNNSVQKYYTPDPNRSSSLPDDNMWTSDEFIEYLRSKGQSEVWKESVIPGMKKAILCSLLSAQDQVEPRKGSFELFGADFMLDEDLQPWLIEINSSPSMARNTRATTRLVDCVMEDTIKVVLDRKSDRTCDVGRFELAYRAQMISDPPHTDPDMSVEGKKIKHRMLRKSP